MKYNLIYLFLVSTIMNYLVLCFDFQDQETIYNIAGNCDPEKCPKTRLNWVYFTCPE